MVGEITLDVAGNAIVVCFIEVYKEILNQMGECEEFEFEEECEEVKNFNVKFIIKKTFPDVGGNFGDLDKESVVKVIYSLGDYSAKFRRPRVIDRHVAEIVWLGEKLE